MMTKNQEGKLAHWGLPAKMAVRVCVCKVHIINGTRSSGCGSSENVGRWTHAEGRGLGRGLALLRLLWRSGDDTPESF